jgi:hypothetical protein
MCSMNLKPWMKTNKYLKPEYIIEIKKYCRDKKVTTVLFAAAIWNKSSFHMKNPDESFWIHSSLELPPAFTA